MSNLWPSLIQTLRALIRTPGFTLAAGMTLALGIGLNAAMLAVFDRLYLRPLPFRDLDRIVGVYGAILNGSSGNLLSAANFLDLQQRATRVEGMAAYRETNLSLAGEVDTERIAAAGVTAQFFPLLRVQPHLGRVFRPEEDRPDGPRAVLLGHAFWRSRFGGDPSLVGRRIHLNGQPTEVVGILPKGFHLGGLMQAPRAFVPLRLDPAAARTERGNQSVWAIARLRTGVSLSQADQELKSIASQLVAEYPSVNGPRKGFQTAAVAPLTARATAGQSTLAATLLSLAAFLLLIACANVSNLVLTRGLVRQHELAIRSALGAGRALLGRGLMLECTVLALAGALGGAGVGKGLLILLQRWFPDLAQLREAGLDGGTLLGILGSTLLALALAGLAPVLRLSRFQPMAALKEGQKGSSGLRQRRFQSALLATQIGLSMVLLTGAGLMLLSLWKLQRVELGIRPEGLLTASTVLVGPKYTDDAVAHAFVRRLQDRLGALPGVRGAAATNIPPVMGGSGMTEFRLPGQEWRPGFWTHVATPEYFATVGVPVVQGTVPSRPGPDQCLLNEAAARALGLGTDAAGRSIEMYEADGTCSPLRIAGVVGNVRLRGLASGHVTQVYTFPVDGAPRSPRRLNLYLKCEGDPWRQSAPLKAVLRELDPDLALYNVRTVEQVIQAHLQERNTTTALFILFGSLGLLLAGVGLYGLMAYQVAQRTREIGIRGALGADAFRLAREVLRTSLGLAVIGLGLGTLLSLALGKFLASQLFHVSPLDPLALGASALVLGLVALLASFFPALRAACVDPAVALRND